MHQDVVVVGSGGVEPVSETEDGALPCQRLGCVQLVGFSTQSPTARISGTHHCRVK